MLINFLGHLHGLQSFLQVDFFHDANLQQLVLLLLKLIIGMFELNNCALKVLQLAFHRSLLSQLILKFGIALFELVDARVDLLHLLSEEVEGCSILGILLLQRVQLLPVSVFYLNVQAGFGLLKLVVLALQIPNLLPHRSKLCNELAVVV